MAINSEPLRGSPWSRSHATLELGIPSTPANSFITDICHLFVRDRIKWLASGTWVALLAALDIAGPTARTALHRMTKAGFLERQAKDGRPGYVMSRAWLDLMRQSYDEPASLGEAEDAWTLLTFSIPETQRADRHAIRTLLARYGFAPLGNGVWLASAARLPTIRVMLEFAGFEDYVDLFRADYEGFAELTELARRCWDIDAIAATYRTFIRDMRRRLKTPPAADPGTFTDVVVASNTWRRISFSDPGLPISALPQDWPYNEAKRARDELVNGFIDPARSYVDSLRSAG